MPIANATTLASLDDLIITEYINEIAAQSLGRAPTVYQHGVLAVSLAGRNTNVYAHPLRSEIAQASVKAETVEATVAEMTTTENTVSTAMVSIAVFISDEAQQDSIWEALRMGAEEVTWSIERKTDADFCALMSGFSSPIGTDATVHTVSNFVTVQTAFTARVESTPEMPLMVIHPDARRDLQQDAVSNAASWFGASMGETFHDAVSGVNNGRVSQFDGIKMVTSSRVPVGGITGWSNAMIVPGGRNAAIAMPVLKPIELEFQREGLRAGGYVIGRARYGVGEVDDTAGLTFVTRT
jgi:hypothetical protein